MVVPTMLTPDQASDTQAGHTPGPWTAIIRNNGFQIDAEMDAVATSAFCYAHEVEANARLIAAAPDLLEASLALAALYDGIWVKMSDAENAACREAWRAMDAAIAKALGQETPR